MLSEASNGAPSFSQVMVGEGKARASQIREMGLLMVTVTSSSALSSVAPRMVGTTAVEGGEGARERRSPTLGPRMLVSRGLQPWAPGLGKSQPRCFGYLHRTYGKLRLRGAQACAMDLNSGLGNLEPQPSHRSAMP